MSGLIWKDLLVMRKTIKFYVIMLGCYLALAVMGLMDLSIITAMMNVMIMMLPISAFAYDEQARWNKYAMSMPLGLRTVVGARYVFVLLIALCAGAFGLLACTIGSVLGHGNLMEEVSTILASLGVGLFIVDILLPLNYKLGPERARPYLMAVVFLPIIALFGIYKLGFWDGVDLSWLDRLPAAGVLGLFSLIPLATLLGLLPSYLISCRIMAHKEF